MLRSADKRLFDGLPLSTAFGPGKLARVPYAHVPPVTPDAAWFDAAPWRTLVNRDLASNFVLSGTTITAWRDRLGLGRAAATGGTVSIDTTTHAQHPVVSFPSANENYLQCHTTFNLSRPYSVFVVASVTSLATFRSMCGNPTGGGFAFRVNTSGQLEVLSSGVAVRAQMSTPVVSAGTPFVAGCVLTSTDITQYLGASSETDSNSTAIPTIAMQIGSDTSPGGEAPMYGWIGEVMVFASALSSGDAAATVAYLQGKWGIA